MKKRPAADHEGLCSLGRQSYASKRAITQLVATFKHDGIPEHCSRATQYRARKRKCGTVTPYGTLVRPLTLVLPNGKTHDAAIQHPLAMLYYVSLECPEFACLMRETLAHTPCSRHSPWNIVLYQDGINPHDGLSSNHSRKSNVFYWSFLEFGAHALCNENNWFPLTLGRQHALTSADGGITQLALKAVLHFFGADECDDIEYIGVRLRFNGSGAGEEHTIFAVLGCILADEPALKEIVCCKGHAGIKQCLMCMNVVAAKASHGAEPLHKFSEYAVSSAEFDPTKFILHTDETIRQCVQRLHGMSTGKATDMEPLYGWGRNPYSLILHPRISLNVASTVMWDFMHCYCCDGLADTELGLYMKHMHTNKTRTSYRELEQYVDGWVIPKSLPKVKQLFSEQPARNNLRKESFTASASEFLTLLPILLRYLFAVCLERGECMPQVESMIAVLLVVELLLAVRTGVVDPDHDQLSTAILKHLNLFKAAYGTDSCRPKHHYVIHLAACLRRFRTLLHTLVQERKHRLVLRYGRDRDSLKNWELGALEEITCHQIWEMSQNYRKSGLQGSHPPKRAVLPLLRELFPHARDSDFRVASSCKARNGTIHVGDLALFHTDTYRVGEVSMLLCVGSKQMCVLSKWERADGGCSMRFARYSFIDDASTIVPAAALECPLMHRPSGDGGITLAYIPFEYRHCM